MNIEIAFRALNRHTGKWFYGGISPCGMFFSHYGDPRVDNTTIGQFIGLIDKKKKKIYDGDILCDYKLDGSRRLFKIFRGKGGFVFNAYQDDFNKPIEQILFTESCSDMQNTSFLESCEIIGNIYENHELLDSSIEDDVLRDFFSCISEKVGNPIEKYSQLKNYLKINSEPNKVMRMTIEHARDCGLLSNKITKDVAKQIFKDKGTIRELAKKYNIGKTQIGYIKQGKRWKE